MTFRGSPRCSATPAALAARISGAVAGARDPGLSVRIEIEDRPHATAASVRLARGMDELGTKRILATSCDEALDAALAVAALALGAPPATLPAVGSEPVGAASSPNGAPRPSTSASFEPVPDEALAPEREGDASEPRDREPGSAPKGESPSAASPALQGLWSAGIDRGALATLTPVLGLGVGASLGRDELRVRLAYGLPLTTERDEAGVGLERERTDFAALSVEGCRALGGARWLAFCAGLEGRTTRSSQLVALAEQPASSRRRFASGAWAQLGTAFVYRELTWQPRLDVSAQLPLFGSRGAAEVIGARAAFGGCLPF